MKKVSRKKSVSLADCVRRVPIGGKGSSLPWHLELYVAGKTPKADVALANLKKVCDNYLSGRCLIEIVGLLENPERAAIDQILTLPMVVRRLPIPVRKIIGDMSNTERVVTGLEIPPIEMLGGQTSG